MTPLFHGHNFNVSNFFFHLFIFEFLKLIECQELEINRRVILLPCRSSLALVVNLENSEM